MEFDEFGSPIGGNWWDYITPPSIDEAPMGSDVNLAPTPAQQIDYSGATYVGSTNPGFAPDNSQDYAIFRWDTGEEIQTSPTGQIVAYQPGYSTYENPENVRAGYRNTPYAFSDIRSGDVEPGYTMFQGQKVPVAANEYLINPVTGKVILDERGNPVIQGTINPNMGGDNWVKNTGLLTQLAMAGMLGYGLYDAAAGAAAGAGAGSQSGALTVPEILGSTGFTPTAGSSFGIVPGAAGAAGQALPYTTAYDAANLYGQGLSQAAIEQNLAMTGIDSFLAADAATLASQGLSDAAIAQNLSYGYSPAELAGTGIESMALTSGGTGIDNLLSSLGSALKTPLGQLGVRGGLGLLAGGGGGAAQQVVPQMAGGSSTYAPKGQVDYTPILNLLAPKQIARSTNSLLG